MVKRQIGISSIVPYIKNLYYKVEIEEWKLYKRVNHWDPIKKGNLFRYIRRSYILLSLVERATAKQLLSNHLRVILIG